MCKLYITYTQIGKYNKSIKFKEESQMLNNTQLPEDLPKNQFVFIETQKDIINMLSVNGFTISQARYLFTCILSQFERDMPVTNHKQ